MWMYHSAKHSEKPIALFEYQPTRKGENAKKFLAGFHGYLHVDGYAGYKQLEDLGVTIVECWGHARRKFEDVLKSIAKEHRHKSEANTGVAYCDKLFALEREYNEQNLTHEERRLRREEESRPVLNEFFDWVDSAIPKFLPKSLMGGALGYALRQRHWLENFMLDGRLELSNNRAERSIRPFTLGRKNWLFSMVPRGAEASAIAYSIIETAYANGLIPYAYLTFLFETMPNITPDRYSECLPWNVPDLSVSI